MKYKILMLIVCVMFMVGSALPAFARFSAPCTWDWDRYMWQHYGMEFWTCWSYDNTNGWTAEEFWTPDYGYWTPDSSGNSSGS